VLKITEDFKYGRARNMKESVKLLISKSVRRGDVDGLIEILGSKKTATDAIKMYKRIHGDINSKRGTVL
jgi:hypothetical protein